MERVNLGKQRNRAPFSLSQSLSGHKCTQPWLVCCCGHASVSAGTGSSCPWGSASFHIPSAGCSSVSRQQHCRQSGNQMLDPLVLQGIAYKREECSLGCVMVSALLSRVTPSDGCLHMACSKWWTCCMRLVLKSVHV